MLFHQVYGILFLFLKTLLPFEELCSHFMERVDVNALFVGHGGDHIMALAHLI